jgi:arylsulfatase A-like enzyme
MQGRPAGSGNISRRRFLYSTAAVGGATLLWSSRWALSQTDRFQRPSIILLVADDQRSESMGCAGNTIVQTPNLDSIAARGVRFTQSFATTAICPTARVSLLTGLLAATHKIEDFFTPVPANIFPNTHAQILRRAGYRVGFVGKWGIGGDLPKSSYDYFEGFAGQGFYWEPSESKHLTVRQGDQAVDFIHTCNNRDPFFLQLSFKAPHVQDEGRDKPGIYAKYPYDPALKDLYANDVIPPPKSHDLDAQPAFFQPTLSCTREAPDFHPQTYQEAVKDLYRLISGLDIAVGRILAAVKQIGAQDNTIVIVTADHGSIYGEHGLGGKWLMYEESIRRATIIADPRLPFARFGTTREEMVLSVDIHPTIVDIAGEKIPPYIQGTSLLPLVRGENPSWRPEWYYRFHNEPTALIVPSEGIRNKNWKYIRYIQSDPLCEQLFDLSADPIETQNLAQAPQHAKTLDELRQRWQVWQQTLAAFNLSAQWVDPT